MSNNDSTTCMEQKPYLSIVIPAYNEESNLEMNVLDIVTEYFSKQKYTYEIIVVDDGSNDKSAELIEAYAKNHQDVRFIKNPHRGKAFTVKTGVEAAEGKYVLFTDMDQATPPEEVEKLLPFLDQRNYDIAIGSREIMGSKRQNEPWHRHLMGKGFNIIVQLLTVRNIHDTQCGFKLFKTPVAKELFAAMLVNRSHGDVKGPMVTVFDVELLFLAQKRKYKIAEVPIYWSHVETKRVSPLKDSYRAFKDILKIRYNDLRGMYAITTKKP